MTGTGPADGRLRLRFGLNETVNWRQFADGPHREQLGARFRELHTHAVRLIVFDKGAPDPVGDWEPFASCVRAVLGAGAVPMVTFAKFGPPYDDAAAVRAFAGRCADVVAACVRHWGEAVRDWYWCVWHHPNSDWVSAGMTFDHYRRIYEETAQGMLRHLTPLLQGRKPRVGGPAVDGFQPFWSDWIWRFVNEIDNALIGFASWHQFGEWREAGAWGAPADEATFRTLLLARASEYESRARAVSRMLKHRDILNVCGELNAHAHHEPRVSRAYNQTVFGAAYYASALLGLMRGGADLELWKAGSDDGGPYGLVDGAGAPNPVFHAKRLMAEHVRFGDRVRFPELPAGLGVDVVTIQGENGRRSAVVVHRKDVRTTYEIAQLVGDRAVYPTLSKLDGATGGVGTPGPCRDTLVFDGYGVAVLPATREQQGDFTVDTKPTVDPKPVPRKNRLLRAILKPLILLLLYFLVLEIVIHLTYAIRNARVQAVPLPYVIGHDYGPLPPWLSDLMILAPDKDLIWRSRPNLRRRYVDIFSPVANEAERRSLLRRFWPSLPEAWKDNPSWEIALNAEGFRTDAPAKVKPACRVICLGDSWTFGMNVGQEQTYPRRLQALLREALPQGDIEVVNLGVLGYSSYQGLELLKKKAPELNPDVVLIGFGMNDAKVNEVKGAAVSDRDAAAYEKNPTFGDGAVRFLKKSETFNLLAYLAQLATYEQKSLDHYLKDEADEGEADDEPVPPLSAVPPKGEGQKEEKIEDPYDWLKYARVPPADYEQNVRAMVRFARGRGASVVLLYNELWVDGPYQKALARVAASENVPLVNGSALIAEARRKVEQALERQLGLVSADAGIVLKRGVEVVFRVYLGDRPVPRGVFIAGPHPMLGDCIPNKVALYDDGTHGDQKAGDGVWSYTATFRAGANVHYVYTNSGAEGQWEGLDVPHIREFKVEPKDKGKRLYLPVETFGKIYVQADGWHPNAEGYDLIAQAVCEVLRKRGQAPFSR